MRKRGRVRCRGFTGTTGYYEEPLAPELIVDTAALTIDDAVALVLAYMTERIAFERDDALSI